MVTYLFADKNKAAFVNAINKLLKNNELGYEVSSTDLINPSPSKTESTLFVTDDENEVYIMDDAIKSKYFKFPIEKVNIKNMKEQINKNKNSKLS